MRCLLPGSGTGASGKWIRIVWSRRENSLAPWRYVCCSSTSARLIFVWIDAGTQGCRQERSFATQNSLAASKWPWQPWSTTMPKREWAFIETVCPSARMACRHSDAVWAL
jgi:hypothetical protein